jgi:RHS repeat-associated protein
LLASVERLAHADTGVSDERVSLPDGPGSIGGIGENVQVEGNMGLMQLQVPIRTPDGFSGVSPQLALSYSSGSGSSVAGIGWSFEQSSVERMTSKGLPVYSTADLFAADGGEELVRVSGSGDRVIYRARYEREFARYNWIGGGDGKNGYWKVELPDGRVSYYGADRDGNSVRSARVEHPNGGTFRYMLVDTVDPFGNRLHHDYVLTDGYPLLDAIGYVYGTDDKPRFSVRFVYAERPDAISDAKPGFDLRLTRRLTEVRVRSGSEQIRGYTLEYETDAQSGGMSRLRRVTETGRGGAMYPIRPTFAYSRALGGACTTDCEKPFMVDMGTLSGGVDMRTGTATLIDINGDSLPDVVDTTAGTHTFYVSVPNADGKPHFADKTVVSKGSTSAFRLGSPGVQVLDVDGNGLADMISSKTGDVLCNDGSGDWSGQGCLADSALDFDLSDDPDVSGESDPLHVRFFDYDNDRRIDILRTTSDASADVRRDDGHGFVSAPVDPIGAVFDASTLQLADMNGDGLQDPVELLGGGQLRFRLNLGRGKWSDWQSVTIGGLGEASLLAADLDDINGDGLADLVVVSGNSLQYALNRNAARFDPPVTVSGDAVNGSVPERTDQTTVLYADMNGNGSDDVVWISSNGHVQFLDLFPVKPNLLARVENGIGMVQTVTYGTALAEFARDSQWAYRLNNAMNLVKRLDTWVTLTGKDGGQGLHEVHEFGYRDGYYDGGEKQFRGFARVERRLLGDMRDSQQPGVTVMDYDVGAKDPYFSGLLLRNDSFALDGEKRRTLSSERNEYSDCPIAEVTNSELTVKVRHVCPTAQWRVEQEGADEAEWASVQTKLEYDGYGNVIRSSELGVVNRGTPDAPKACAACADDGEVACGPDCSGDENYTETEYVVPGSATAGAWFVRSPSREVIYGAQGGPRRETLFYYDGAAFEGMEAGKLTQGKLTRAMRRVSADGDNFIARTRNAFDAHGNVIAELDPLGKPDGTDHRQNTTYDPLLGLNIVATEALLSDDAGPYALRREYTYEASWNEINESTEWMFARGDAVQSGRDSTRYRYDDQGRVAKIIRPGDSEDAPSLSYAYELADPLSTIRAVGRAQPGDKTDNETLECIDGRGRTVQTLTRVADGRYFADGWNEFNSRGSLVRGYQSHTVSGSGCATTAPEGVPFVAYSYDPTQRPLTITQPDAELYDGKASFKRTRYAPLAAFQYDAEDTAEAGSHADTPTVKRYDGLGRLVSIERKLEKGSAVTQLRYDSLGNLRGYRDAMGHVRTQEFDLLDRVTRVDDPNAGRTTFEYDAAGNLVRKVDAGGSDVRSAFDGLNRLREQWSASNRDQTLVRSTYDALDCKDCTALPGRIAEVKYPVVLGDERSQGFDRFGYDARRRLVYEARSLEGHLFETHSTFDGLDRLTRKVYPDGQTVERRYDGADRLVEIPGVLTAAAYDDTGLLSKQTFANGASQSYRYDVMQRVAGHSLRDGSDKAVFDLTFTRDRVGNLLSVKDDAPARSGRVSRSANYAYDAWYRSTELAQMPAGGSEKVALTFDMIDNVTKRTSSLGAQSAAQLGDISYDKTHPNAVASVGALAFGYDATGQLTRRGDLKLEWDHLNRLTKATRGGEAQGAYAYGPEEERVLKDESGHVVYYVGEEFEVRDGISAVYPRLEREDLARLESSALATEVLADANGDDSIDIADAVLAQAKSAAKSGAPITRLLAAAANHALFDPDLAKTFLHVDHAENVVAATSAKGALVAERDFLGYGSERESSGFVDAHGFAGQEQDAATGFLHYRFRYLDAEVGRWISPDPAFEITSPESMLRDGEASTAYVFVANNWINSVDPFGLDRTKAKAARAAAKKVKQARKDANTGRSNYIRKGDAAGDSVTSAVKMKEGYHDIIVHGDKTSFSDASATDATEWNVKELATKIKSDPNWAGGPVRLWGCKTGATGATAAKDLARELGVKVKAPSGTLALVKNDTKLVVQRSLRDPVPSWRTFKPPKKN